MNKQTFEQCVKDLASTFGANRWPQPRIERMWRELSDLPDRWFIQTVDRVILEFDLNFNFAQAAREFRNRSKNDYKKPVDDQNPQHAGETLDVYLKRIGAKNLKEAIRKLNTKEQP